MKHNFVKSLVFISISLNINSVYANTEITTNTNVKEIHDIAKRPILTTAGIVHKCPEDEIILIERGKAPFGYAMFGGHV